MGFSDDINKEFAQILKKRDNVVKTGAVSLFGDLQVNTPVDTGEARDSWQPPEKLGTLSWRIGNIAPHIIILDGGRRQIVTKNGTAKWIGSEQLPNGFDPVIKAFEPKLQRELDKIE